MSPRVTAPSADMQMRMYAAAGTKTPIIELAADFQKVTGHTVVLVFDTAGATEQRFLADAGATFLITTLARIVDAEKKGKLSSGATRLLGDTVGGFAAAPGTAKPDISAPGKLRATLLAVPRIVFSDPARGATVGKHFLHVIETLGIREDVVTKSTLARDGVETMRMVLAGEADLGVTQISEVVQADPSALVGPFPKEFDLATTYALWYRADAPPEAKAFAEIITGPAGRAKLLQHGLRPPTGQFP